MRMRLVVLAFALVLAAVFALAQAGHTPDPREQAVINTALDYSDGAYSSDAGRMERALHPDLTKLIFMRRSPAMGLAARYSTFSDLIEPARTKGFFLEPDKRKTETAVLEITDDVACVKVKTAMWCDYLQMIKVNGQWKIINVLWTLGLDTPPQGKVVPGFDAEKERPAAQAAALDYTEGQLSGDAARLEKVLHPETNQVTLMTMATAEAKVSFVMRSRYSGILEPVKAKLGLAPENARKAEVRILDMMDGMAFAAARTARGAAYLQLQLLDGQWKVINVLVRPTDNAIPQTPPAAPSPQAPAAGQARVFRPGIIGFPMTDFSLPALQGGTFGPSALKGKNVLLVFPRGKVDDTWCWICHYQYAELAELEAKLQLRKTFDLEILFVLPYGESEARHWTEIFPSQMKTIEAFVNPPGFDQFPARRKEMVTRMQKAYSKASEFAKGPVPLPFPILYDQDQAVSKMLGLFTTNWDDSAVDQNIPTIYLLDAAGDVRFKYMSQITFDRPGGEYLVKILEKLVQGR